MVNSHETAELGQRDAQRFDAHEFSSEYSFRLASSGRTSIEPPSSHVRPVSVLGTRGWGAVWGPARDAGPKRGMRYSLLVSFEEISRNQRAAPLCRMVVNVESIVLWKVGKSCRRFFQGFVFVAIQKVNNREILVVSYISQLPNKT